MSGWVGYLPLMRGVGQMACSRVSTTWYCLGSASLPGTTGSVVRSGSLWVGGWVGGWVIRR